MILQFIKILLNHLPEKQTEKPSYCDLFRLSLKKKINTFETLVNFFLDQQKRFITVFYFFKFSLVLIALIF
jgi:hypothetical protein